MLTAYIIGLALGDGNLSNQNGRAPRLRISCDKKYPILLNRVSASLTKLLPDNKVHIINRKGCFDVSCYSNYLPTILGWKPKGGSKYIQKTTIPSWIRENPKHLKACLRGLIETDGSVYIDRGYTMVNFVTIIPELAKQVFESLKHIGYRPNLQITQPKTGKEKITIRIARDAQAFINDLEIMKS